MRAGALNASDLWSSARICNRAVCAVKRVLIISNVIHSVTSHYATSPAPNYSILPTLHTFPLRRFHPSVVTVDVTVGSLSLPFCCCFVCHDSLNREYQSSAAYSDVELERILTQVAIRGVMKLVRICIKKLSIEINFFKSLCIYKNINIYKYIE